MNATQTRNASVKQTIPPMPREFTYLGLKFYAVRRFTSKETKQGINLPLCSIGISNYPDQNNWLSSQWNHKDFFLAAASTGSAPMDIYRMNGTALVIPGTNELWAYGKEEAMKIGRPAATREQTAKERFEELKTSIYERLSSLHNKVGKRQKAGQIIWADCGDLGHILEGLKDLDDHFRA
jgi:hypothetical protein